jgi:nucleoside-diphosphate-sugar epimerase
VLNRGVTPAPPLPAVERLTADRSDEAALAAVLAGRRFDLVVDTTLYTGTEARILARVLDGRVGRYVWWSSGQVYLVRVGPVRPFRESDYEGPLMPPPPPTRADDLRNWRYGMDKRAAEFALFEAHAATGFPVVSLRMPMINSERDHHGRIAGYAHRLAGGGPLLIADDTQPLRHVYGGDVVAATLRASDPDLPTGEAWNIGQDETISLETMLHLVAAETARVMGLADSPSPRMLRLPRATLERHGLLPACSPFSDRWMSALDNARSKATLGMTYRAPAAYVPRVVEAAIAIPPDRVPGLAQRSRELALAGELRR